MQSRPSLRLLSPICITLIAIGLCFDRFKPAEAQAQPAIAPVAPTLPLNGTLVPIDPATPQAPPTSATSPTPPSALQFTFTNTLEYGDCIEVILQRYKKTREFTSRERQSQCFTNLQQVYPSESLTRVETLNAIATANFYATTLLDRELYPVKGQRMRVAQQFGFIYKIDETDSIIREMASHAEQ